MDNFDKLGLQLIQRMTGNVQNEPIQAVKADPETEKPKKTVKTAVPPTEKTKMQNTVTGKTQIPNFGRPKK